VSFHTQPWRYSGEERAWGATPTVSGHHRHSAVIPAQEETGAHVEKHDTRWGEHFFIILLVTRAMPTVQ
jgi:hypothetical protein